MPFNPNQAFEIDAEAEVPTDNAGSGFDPNQQFDVIQPSQPNSGPSQEQIRGMSPISSEPYSADRAKLNFVPSEEQPGSNFKGIAESLYDYSTLLKVPAVQPAWEMGEDYIINDPLYGRSPGESHRKRLEQTTAAQKRSPIGAVAADVTGYLALPASPIITTAGKLGSKAISYSPTLTNLALSASKSTNLLSKGSKTALSVAKAGGRVVDEASLAGMDTLFKEEDVPRSVANAFMAGAIQSGVEVTIPTSKLLWKQFKRILPATEMTPSAVNGLWAQISHFFKPGQDMSAGDIQNLFDDVSRRRKVKLLNTSSAQEIGQTMAKNTIDVAKDLKKSREHFAANMSREYGRELKPFLDVNSPEAFKETEKAIAGLQDIIGSIEKKPASYTSPVLNASNNIKSLLNEGFSKQGDEGLTYFQIHQQTELALKSLENPTPETVLEILKKEKNQLENATGYMKENLLNSRKNISKLIYGTDTTTGMKFSPGTADKVALVKMRNHIDKSLKAMGENAESLVKADELFTEYKDVFGDFDRFLGKGTDINPSKLRTGLKSPRESGQQFRDNLKVVKEYIGQDDAAIKKMVTDSGIDKSLARVEDLMKDLDMERMIEQSKRTMGPSSSRGVSPGAILTGAAIATKSPSLMFFFAPLIDPYAWTNIVDSIATTKNMKPEQLKAMTKWWERSAKNAADKYPELLTHVQRQIRIIDRPSRAERDETKSDKTITSSLVNKTEALPSTIADETKIFDKPSSAVRNVIAEGEEKQGININPESLPTIQTNKGIYFPDYKMSVPSLPTEFDTWETSKQKAWLIKNGQKGQPQDLKDNL
jgi:hypothetical protein